MFLRRLDVAQGGKRREIDAARFYRSQLHFFIVVPAHWLTPDARLRGM